MTFKHLRPYLICTALLALALLASVAIGPVFVPPGTVLRVLLARIPGLALAADWPAFVPTIVTEIRLPHAMLMALTGAALAGSGAAFQGLFRNPLADPYLIGDRGGVRRRAGRGLLAGIELAAQPAGHVFRSGGGIPGRGCHGGAGVLAGARRAHLAHDNPDPGRRGGQRFCHLYDLVLDAALQRRATA
jgi:ABC-type Fe3+-siderophore transport system permease subunit